MIPALNAKAYACTTLNVTASLLPAGIVRLLSLVALSQRGRPLFQSFLGSGWLSVYRVQTFAIRYGPNGMAFKVATPCGPVPKLNAQQCTAISQQLAGYLAVKL
jgi:hypothetical protein